MADDRCKTEQECAHEPWCRINGECGKARPWVPCPHVPGATCASRAECCGDGGCVRMWPRDAKPTRVQFPKDKPGMYGTAGVKVAPQPDLKDLLDRFQRQAQRFGELWERCQGKGWPQAESDEFTAIRDERLPALRRAIEDAAGVPDLTAAQAAAAVARRDTVYGSAGVPGQVKEGGNGV